jgi:hypothetical protein
MAQRRKAWSSLLGHNVTNATMPFLTTKHKIPSPATCQAWAAAQDDDAIDNVGYPGINITARVLGEIILPLRP